mgnify:CR=1 FL=1
MLDLVGIMVVGLSFFCCVNMPRVELFKVRVPAMLAVRGPLLLPLVLMHRLFVLKILQLLIPLLLLGFFVLEHIDVLAALLVELFNCFVRAGSVVVEVIVFSYKAKLAC